MQQLTAALEQAWAVIPRHHAELPDIVVTVGTGSGHHGGVRKLGHFAWSFGVRARFEQAGRRVATSRPQAAQARRYHLAAGLQRSGYAATPRTATVSEWRRQALARIYLGASRVAEALGCTQTWLARLRSEDPDFPAHAVEIHEPKAVFLGWPERSIIAYRQRRHSRQGRPGPARPPSRPPKAYVGINQMAQLLEVTRSRALQLRASDPRFPPPRVQLQERTRLRDGYDEAGARAYAAQRHPRPGRPPKSG